MRFDQLALLVEPPPDNRRQQNRKGVLAPHFGDKSDQIVSIVRARCGITLRVFALLVVVSELDEDVIALSQSIDNGLPATFIDETLRASTVLRVILDSDFCAAELALQIFAPTRLGPFVGRLLRQRGITGEIDHDRRVLGQSLEAAGQDNKQQSQNPYFHGYRLHLSVGVPAMSFLSTGLYSLGAVIILSAF